jgi:subtilisin family serine protease
MRKASERMLIVAVSNPRASLTTRAASTTGAYATNPVYAANGSARATLDALKIEYRLSEVASWPIAPLDLHCVVLQIADDDSQDRLIDALRADSRVKLVQPLQSFSALRSAYNDPYVELQSGFAAIDAASAHLVTRGDGIRVAVIDTGVDLSHLDLQGARIEAKNFVDNDLDRFKSDRHGTQVVGIIAAVANNKEGIVGVAPSVRLLILKACWETRTWQGSAECNSFTLAKALGAALDSGAQVINMSLGGPADPLLTLLVDRCVERGIVVVGAVPPNGDLSGFPVGVHGVIPADVTERSRQPPQIVHAPGLNILTLVPGSHYDFASGSSMAAAHVSAVAALLLAVDPHLSPATIAAMLQPAGDSSASGRASINACALVAALRPHTKCDPEPRVAGGFNNATPDAGLR